MYGTYKPNSRPGDEIFEKWLYGQVLKKYREYKTNKKLDSFNNIYLNPHNSTWIYESLDFYRRFKQDNPNFDITSYSIDKIYDLAKEWHEAIAGKGSGKMYEPTDPNNIVYRYENPKGWTIQAVTTENDLLAEGNKMDNCVSSYANDVKKGYIYVYSLRNDKNYPLATIGIDGDGKRVTEIKANGNEEPDTNMKKIIGEWLKTIPGVDLNNKYEIEEGLSELDYISEKFLDDELMKLLEKTANGFDDYGIPLNADKNIEPFYSKISSKLSKNSARNIWWQGPVADVAQTLAEYAFIFDIDALKKYLTKGLTISRKEWADESSVEFLKDKEISDLENLYSEWEPNDYRYDLDENEPDPDDYEDGENDPGYIKAMEEHEEKVREYTDYWKDEEIKGYVKENMPYALNDYIADYLNGGKEKEEYDELLSKVLED